MKILLTFLLFLFSGSLIGQWSFSLESGAFFQAYNDFRVPNDGGTTLSFTDQFDRDGITIPIRVQARRTWSDRNHLTFLFAPLNLDYKGELDEDILFKGIEFARNQGISGFYKFNSYRISYRRDLIFTDNWTFGLGLTVKLRDATIRLTADTAHGRETDVGFVPLANLHLGYRNENWGVFLEGDGLASSQGRAFDFFIGGRYYPVDDFSLMLGYRFLEGGADVSDVYNFTLIHFISLGLTVEFN